jgi:cell division protein FtsI (penicillin-binding protein 3)
MTAHMVGFTGVDDKGLEGVELAFHGQLLGQPGSRSVIKDRRGQIVEDVGSIKPPQDGKEIRLALDSKIQYLAYSHLKQAIAENKAKAGGVVVLDVRTGEIVALANWPTYNPNNREGLSGGQLRNRAVTDTFEPGSTLKPFTIGLALENGKVRSDTVINCAPGRLTIGSATISDAHPHGAADGGARSSRSRRMSAAAKIAAMLPAQKMWQMFDDVGFGQVPRLGFPGEVSGRVRPWKNWRPIEQATMSYGHGISVSLIQLARAYSVFAREGDLMPLSLTRTRRPLRQPAPRCSARRPLAKFAACLKWLSCQAGRRPRRRFPVTAVAGKTGTAHKLEGGRYANKFVSSFVGFAPAVGSAADRRRHDRRTQWWQAHYGGDVAAPVFAAVMGNSLRTLGIAPDAPLVVAQSPKTPTPKARL